MGETKQLQELGEYPFLGFFQKFFELATSSAISCAKFTKRLRKAFFNGKQAGSRNGESARFACGGVAEAVRMPRLWSQQHGWVGGGGRLKMAFAGCCTPVHRRSLTPICVVCWLFVEWVE